MNFDQLNTKAGAEAGFELRLTHPESGEPMEAWITVRGYDSATVRQAANNLQREVQVRLSRKRGAAAVYDPAKQDEDEIGLLVAATVGWRGIGLGVDAETPYTPEAAKRFYSDPGFSWARKQVERAMGEYANFLPASSKSSPDSQKAS